ncbi:LysR family transcriptional regulator (plasmid) [Rhizobium leguminosarum]|nr:LysR family transcriptional regulator [Rhizobium leguminosarum]
MAIIADQLRHCGDNQMDKIDGMRTFVAVVEAGSFAGASKRLGITGKLASKYIAMLEAQLGMNLLHRTTRSMSLTHDGRTYLEGCRRVLNEIDLLDMSLESSSGLKGMLRVAAPLTFGETVVATAALEFMDTHPEVTIELELSDEYVDLAEKGFDLAVRIGALKDSSLVARKLGEARLVVVAAPSYIERHGAPSHPDELSAHICIRDANNPDPNRWTFVIEGQQVHIPVAGPFVANSPPACLLPTRAGKGIFICPHVFLDDDLTQGRLVQLLPGFPSRTIAIQSVQLPSAFRKPKVSAFINTLRKHIR